jgi:hypothetical protein
MKEAMVVFIILGWAGYALFQYSLIFTDLL